MIRSFAFSGATFFALALLLSVVFKFKSRLAKHWPTRRNLGVLGFLFIVIHVFSVIQTNFQGDVSGTFYNLNPLVNPLIFGWLAYPIFFLLFITSSDWAVAKLRTKWKVVQRLMYFGYLGAVLHFLTINPSALWNIAGYLLIFVTILAMAGGLFWFIKLVASGRSSRRGIIIILLWILGLYLIFF
ncbi:MAG: ferric reductase-like transmembrane domain-containing protein [Candidatus Aenigmatarchaeota archaeon]